MRRACPNLYRSIRHLTYPTHPTYPTLPISSLRLACALRQRSPFIDREVRPLLAPTARPDDTDPRYGGRRAETHKDPRIVGGGVAAVRPRPPPQRRALFAKDTDPCAEHVAGRLAADEPQSEPAIAVADVVEQKPHRPAVVGDDDVGVAIIIQIAERRAATYLGELKDRPSA